MIDARAVDGQGRPLLGLTAADFRVKVDGKPVALESATWMRGQGARRAAARGRGRRLAEPTGDVVVGGLPPGRLIVFLFQKDFHPSRLPGLMRMQQKAVKFLETLGARGPRGGDVDRHPPQALAGLHGRPREGAPRHRAVGLLRQVRHRTIRGGAVPGRPLRLRRGARRVGTPETALLVTARALKPLPGTKSLVVLRVRHGPAELAATSR